MSLKSTMYHFLQFDLQYSSLALLFYDYALTFPQEVRYIWTQRFRLSTVLYIGCRYPLLANLLYLLDIAHELGSRVRVRQLGSTGQGLSNIRSIHVSLNRIEERSPVEIHRCELWYRVVAALSVLGRGCVIAVFTLRTHAVFGRNMWILAYMGALGLACIALDIMHIPELRCVHYRTPPIGRASEILSILIVLFESSSALLTGFRCVVAFRRGGPAMRRHGLVRILLEHGIIYFCTISVFTTAGVILNYRAPVSEHILALRKPSSRPLTLQPGLLQRLPNAYTIPLSCVLTARFILLLRKWDARQLGKPRDRSVKRSGIRFRTPTPSTVFTTTTPTQIISASASPSRGERRSVLSNIVSLDDFGPDPTAKVSMEARVSHEAALEDQDIEEVEVEVQAEAGGGDGEESAWFGA
ncbi:hypothetical protein FB45DRAFT_1036031 [Roridomyces roridus]|uniref:DUF6533 domain-containing protein n=1 Tax=Roridomyces roridus TaxID=1738132 RepID=A0AAD7B9D9_9AGAR|nr:hypothetical protein FB45DRAFT_1036031 [Roridomyces roridus]